MSVGVKTSEVVLKDDMPACIAIPEKPGNYPCILWLHERYGFVTHTREYAEKIAGGGYVVIAPDLYYDFPDQEALHRGDARVGAMSDEVIYERLSASVDHLTTYPVADVNRLGMIGVCATGRYPIVYGSRRPLQAPVIFYGATSGWETDANHPVSMRDMLAGVDAPILGLFGELDHNIPITDVCKFRDLLEERNKSYRIRVFDGAPHGFINDTMTGRYHPIAETAAFMEMQDFFSKTLREKTEGEPTFTRWSFECVQSVNYDFSKNVRLE